MAKPIKPREAELDFYRRQSEISSPGRYEPLFGNLPAGIQDLSKAVQNLLLHQFWIRDEGAYGVSAKSLMASGRNLNDEINLRSVEEILGYLIGMDDRPLTAVREAEKRVVGNCRDYSLLLVSMLRHRGIPARVRSGVAGYFYPKEQGMLEDHFICEFWNAAQARWQRADAQVDDVQREVLRTTLDMTDLPPGQFLDAGESYAELKSENVQPEKIGIFEFRGWPYVRYKLVGDLACVNSVEVLAWERWGICGRIADSQLSQADDNLLETIAENLAALGSRPERFREARELYAANPDLKIPADYDPFYFELPFFK
jgi:hypothetical protein